ncbi:MAG: short chain enoyl-CoA hydratase [Gemmatimonadetes bacterium]|jgi:enoyl-CoA hydratase|nr:short chain enoyl-CoA hydratase [Gemmatimonadota bacterium]
MIGRIITERVGPVTLLVISNADRQNALTASMRDELTHALEWADEEADVRAVVLMGAGERSFAAGGDINELAERTLEQQRHIMENGSVFGAVRRMRKPIVAAINGVCLGGGLELALSCDLRVAVPQARFGQPEVCIGLIPGGGGTQMLPRIIGLGHAMRLVLTGDVIDSDEALRIGLVNEVVPAAALRGRAVSLATHIASRAPLAVLAAKEATRAALDLPFEEGRQRELALFEQCFASADRVEGVGAFLEKRHPSFRGC